MTKKVVQVPSVGRAVHFYALDGKAQAAVISEVEDPLSPRSRLTLTVFPPDEPCMIVRPKFGQGKPGCWGWPEYVPPVEVDEP